MQLIQRLFLFLLIHKYFNEYYLHFIFYNLPCRFRKNDAFCFIRISKKYLRFFFFFVIVHFFKLSIFLYLYSKTLNGKEKLIFSVWNNSEIFLFSFSYYQHFYQQTSLSNSITYFLSNRRERSTDTFEKKNI